MTPEQYQEAIEWLYIQFPNYQKTGATAYKPGLDNIRKLCNFFGNPQDSLQMIHIGGTNGKGSTSNMLSSILQEAGYSVGLYTSPHLIDFTERIKVDGKNCDKAFVFDFIQKLRNLPNDIAPSFFEFTTVMAFEYFKQKKVDFAIIEVGLGGRLDSTNIISPIVSAITNVALDHQDLLGNTVSEIAAEKAGIIKNNIPIISGSENQLVKNIIKEKANQENAPFIDATLINTTQLSDLKGNYQVQNIKVVIAIVDELKKSGVQISTAQLNDGFLNVQRNTGFLGRWYEFSSDPLVICDTAHNMAGLELVFDQLKRIPKFKYMILGFVKEKKIDEVLAILPDDAICLFVKPNVERGRSPEDYEELLKKLKINYKIFDNVQDAYLFAKQQVAKSEMIFIGGSNFIVGEFLEKNLEE